MKQVQKYLVAGMLVTATAIGILGDNMYSTYVADATNSRLQGHVQVTLKLLPEEARNAVPPNLEVNMTARNSKVFDGLASEADGIIFITPNTMEDTVRAQFNVAHEIGHIVDFNMDKSLFNAKFKVTSTNKEVRANSVAIYILLKRGYQIKKLKEYITENFGDMESGTTDAPGWGEASTIFKESMAVVNRY